MSLLPFPGQRPAPAFAPATAHQHRELLVELLALNEEMVAQLEDEQQGGVDTPGFLSSMIGQHERAATLLRAELARSTPALFLLPAEPSARGSAESRPASRVISASPL